MKDRVTYEEGMSLNSIPSMDGSLTSRVFQRTASAFSADVEMYVPSTAVTSITALPPTHRPPVAAA